MRYAAFVFARGGSKGLPGKNIKPFNGKPLIAWSIESALASAHIDTVYVSTDSPDIAEVARQYGAEVPFIRPAELAGDTSAEWLAWRHALNFLAENGGRCPDVMVSLPATAPLRSVADIDRCIELFNNTHPDCVITVTAAHHNPYFNMVRKLPDGTVDLCISGEGKINRRQDVPEIYDITTVAYVVDTRYVMTRDSLFEGTVRMVEVPAERGIDIDTPLDFAIAEYLAKRINHAQFS
jgi:CMP-N-acetylneuraminic acid synthetase